MKVLFRSGRFSFIFAWYDLWTGVYFDVGHRTLYLALVPMLLFRFEEL